MATASVETMQEQPDMMGLAKSTNLAQKRGREDEVGAGTVTDKKWPGWPGDNVFRLLVPAQKVGGIIGRKGEFVKKMCEETRSRIKILEGIPGTPERTGLQLCQEASLQVCSTSVLPSACQEASKLFVLLHILKAICTKNLSFSSDAIGRIPLWSMGDSIFHSILILPDHAKLHTNDKPL
eukprot:Gb_12788 [translate_table: standard]